MLPSTMTNLPLRLDEKLSSLLIKLLLVSSTAMGDLVGVREQRLGDGLFLQLKRAGSAFSESRTSGDPIISTTVYRNELGEVLEATALELERIWEMSLF